MKRQSSKTGKGAGNAAMEVLGARLHQLNKGIKELQGLNINTALSSLPKYAVVGDQSAGKSSIVQALCGTALPRSSGTTTRCPFLITTHQASPSTGHWTCDISIKRQAHSYTNAVTSCDDTELQTTHFATLNNEDELEDTLRRAQIAILNPQHDPGKYADIDLTKEYQPKVFFSKDIICLDIQAPNLPELMFYDLPGCINVYDVPKTARAHGKQRQEQESQLIEMITSTVSSYIQDKQCLILLACSADQDVELSLTMKYIRQHEAEDRCIGVFTKADLVTSTKVQSVQDILRGKKYQLGRGWFVTKQLSQQEIDTGLDYNAARERESELFATEPWAIDHSLNDRYGLPKLQDEIAGSLASHIISELPNMTRRVEARINFVTKELDQFPAPPKEPNYVVMKSIEQFVCCLSSHINADSDDNPFRMEFDRLALAFREQLQASKLEVDTDVTSDQSSDKASQRQNKSNKTQSKKRDGEPASCKRIKPDPFKAAVSKLTYSLTDLQTRYDRGATNSIPGSINDKVTEQLIRESCAEWRHIVEKLLADMESFIRGMIKDAMEEALAAWTHVKLFKSMKQAALDYVKKIMVAQGQEIHKHLARMHAYPTTLDKRFGALEKEHLKHFLQKRYPKSLENHLKMTPSVLTPGFIPQDQLSVDLSDAEHRWINERLTGDEYGRIISCVAKVHTFHDILSCNLADTTSMQLKYDVLKQLRDEAAEMLRTELRVLDKAHCTALLAEDPAREKRRKQLLAEKGKLMQALAVIKDLEDTE